MKFAQITQLLLTLVGTIAAAEADAPYGSGFYFDNKVFFDFVLPNSNFTAVNIWPLTAGKFSYDIEEVYGVYSPSHTRFDVRPDTGTSMEADVMFEDGDISVNMSMVGELTTAFEEDVFKFNVLLQNIEKSDDQEFVVSITVTSLGSSPTSSAITSSSSVVATSPATDSTSSTVPTPTGGSLVPYGSGFYYDNKVFFDFVLPNSNFTEVGIWPLTAGNFSYAIEHVYGVYSPSGTRIDVRTAGGTSMKGDLAFEDGDISANMSMVGELTTAFNEDVVEFNVLLQGLPHDIEKRDDQEFVVTITVTSLGSSPTPITP